MSGAAAAGGKANDTEASDRAWRPRANPWLIAVVVTLAAFMEILDTTIVNVSLPHIAGTVSASYDDATWALTAYLVANGIVLPISGFFGRLLGRKRYFLICIAMFTVCSFLCGMSDSLGELVFFRLLQGFFGGGRAAHFPADGVSATLIVGSTEMPSGSGSLGSSPLSMSIFTGTRCTILTKLPVAFSAGNALKRLPEPSCTLSTWPSSLRLGKASTRMSTFWPGRTRSSWVSL